MEALEGPVRGASADTVNGLQHATPTRENHILAQGLSEVLLFLLLLIVMLVIM